MLRVCVWGLFVYTLYTDKRDMCTFVRAYCMFVFVFVFTYRVACEDLKAVLMRVKFRCGANTAYEQY